ncbi:siderophore-interacting protein [Azospirillum lipoferum]|uniref:Siderophore-interacting protein n=1 Tax=Azospirillum lipoferum (strain 4B) TaxID=862719 RepID=G7ZHU6_AZOL4|nr:siderophore-interacting protein [Azospirillum lipoferum]CBS91136.1 Siderophore-interacting protein [Azospirillum lipoferum 4B]
MAFLKAQATIAFPKVSTYLDTIIQSFSAHNMTVSPDGDGHTVTSSFGTAHLRAAPGALSLAVEATDPADFNRLKHELTGLIDFVTRPENLEIVWTGDAAGAVLPTDLRVLTVREVRQLTPRMRRISFGGDDLARYAVPDQIHCRLLFQGRDIATPQWPFLDDNGRVVWPESGKLDSRIFTIRRIDPAAGTLDIDFVMHGGGGPGLSWAAAAAPGDVVGLLGPAAYGPKPADWYLLAGDETGLPGIARILEGLPASAAGIALIEVADAAERQEIDGPPGVAIRWLYRNGTAPGSTTLLSDALRLVELPAGQDGLFAWIGAEYSAFRDMRSYLKTDIGLPSSRLIAFSHWRRGMSEEDIVKAGIAAVLA